MNLKTCVAVNDPICDDTTLVHVLTPLRVYNTYHAGGETRTLNPARALGFESSVYTNSTTPAYVPLGNLGPSRDQGR